MSSDKQRKSAWGGRFSESTHACMQAFSASVAFDKRLYRHDIRGSLAHARMLVAIGVLTTEEFNAIEKGLATIEKQIEQGEFVWDDSLEDVHMNIEAKLIEYIGDPGKKLHTARSRNDQVSTDIRLYLREQLDSICAELTALQHVFATMAVAEATTIMPGFTHMQSAQSITFGHHLLAWNEMLQRDYERLQECRNRMNVSPLGSAALAGTGFDIDRNMTATELGFSGICRNSLDAVSDRDFAIEFSADAALLMVHLSRMAEEIILWCSDAFRFIDLGDEFCTGSSIMPQKKNPDVAELIRGKSARVTGNLTALLMLMKAQPLAYNRDNQEDKEPLFDSVDTLLLCLDILVAMWPQIKIHRPTMRIAAARGYSTATDFADYLVRKQVPFRDAHEVVGKVVAFALEKQVELAQIEIGDLQQFSTAIEQDIYAVLTVEGSVNSRNHVGGTAPDRVTQAAHEALRLLALRTR